MLHDFEQSLENLRAWMDTVETDLQKPFSLNKFNANELRIYQQAITVCHHLIRKTELIDLFSRLSTMILTNIVQL